MQVGVQKISGPRFTLPFLGFPCHLHEFRRHNAVLRGSGRPFTTTLLGLRGCIRQMTFQEVGDKLNFPALPELVALLRGSRLESGLGEKLRLQTLWKIASAKLIQRMPQLTSF